MLFQQLGEQLQQLQQLLQILPAASYREQIPALGNASMGQHVRHVLELLQCLKDGYEAATVNYDKRKRDLLLETDPLCATSLLEQLSTGLNKPDKPMKMTLPGEEDVSIATWYYRELAYNTEHAIHHMALIRVALRELQLDIVGPAFGVAYATLQYQQSCAR